jgi:AraC-like DNA-binding protein
MRDTVIDTPASKPTVEKVCVDGRNTRSDLKYTAQNQGGIVALRHSDSEANVDIRFDCGANGTFRRSEAANIQQLRLETVTGQVTRTVAGLATVPTGVCALCFNTKGTLLARTSPQSKLIIVPPRSVTYIRGGIRLIIQAARGDHSIQILCWNQLLTPLLDAWAANRATNRSGQISRQIACKPIDPHLQDAYNRFENARNGSLEVAEPMILSSAYELIARLMVSSDEVQLAAVPTTLPETIKELTARVRSNPSLPWPLKDAADAAGYSPFHFSRVFKAMVGYGFHEYVDRCRTEAAVEMLVTSDAAVDVVAATCGFGTTQGLRESVKEYLGLVPSELRAIPEIGNNIGM